MTRTHRQLPLLALAAACVAMTACGGGGGETTTAPAAPLDIKVLSSRSELVSGGSALVEVPLPSGVAASQVKLMRGSTDVTSVLSPSGTTALRGVVTGLPEGSTELRAVDAAGAVLATVTVKNGPITGPIFSGPHQRPWICETETSGLGPAPATGPCQVASRTDWYYKNTAGSFLVLPGLTGSLPTDLAKTTTIDGISVDFIVRIESGTINESIYRIAILDDPKNPIANPWSAGGKKPGAGWNGKLFYHYLGGAAPGYRSGSNSITSALRQGDSIITTDDPLSLGFAVAFGTRNTFGVGQDDVVSAETTAMIKEHFIKNFGLPKFTIGSGSSGGSMQVQLIAQNYPGLLDAIVAVRSFPDQVSITKDVLDCGLITNYVNSIGGTATLAMNKISAIDGYPVNGSTTTCFSFNWQNFANVWQNPSNSSFDSSVPVALRYNALTNPTGARGDYWSGNANSFGTDPLTGFARSAYDNVGVQYGLKALNDGVISKAEFLDLNEEIGGLDADGKIVARRSVGDPVAVAAAYKAGRLNSGRNLTLPLIAYRNYVDLPRNIHSRHRTFATADRLVKANGSRDNLVVWTIAGNSPSSPNLIRESLTTLNTWLDTLAADTTTRTYQQKVVAAKPANAKDACWDADGRRIDEVLSLTPTSACNTLYPIFSDPRIVAGESRAGDIMACQLKPIALSDYAVTFTPSELVRLDSIFPNGVCDWSKPGLHQSMPDGDWLTFGATPGTWTKP